MFKNLLILFFCINSVCVFSEQEHFLVGTNAEFPPFCYIENNAIVGFDIDVAKEVGKKLNRSIQFKDIPFDALIPDVVLGHLDFVAAGMSYTDERVKRVAFTKSYIFKDPLVILTISKQITSVDDLKGKNVVVIEGFTADLFISAIDGIHLTRLPTQADGFMALKSRRADAFVTAKSTVNAFYDVQNASNFHASELEGTGETCALVVPKNNPKLLMDIQKALDEMENDGTLMQLRIKWKLQ